MRSVRTLEDIGEFGIIERIKARAGGRATADVVLGIGDDAALLRVPSGEDLVVSTDASVGGVHFDLALQAPRHIGRRALVANLSDLAAMGARPLAFTVAMSAPPDLPVRVFDGLLAGLLDEARAHACPLVGGNLTRSRDLNLSITVHGRVRRGHALLRSALRPGDRLFVTGQLGASALALARARAQGRKLKYVATPRIAAGRALARRADRGACIDLSDGLASDLGHLAEASGCGVEVQAERLPMPRGFARACARLGLDPLHTALAGGEDYELLFSLRGRPAARRQPSEASLARSLGVMVTEIGSATRRRGVRGLPAGGGWRHF